MNRGSVLPLMALSFAILMGVGGMAMDIGFLEYEQDVQQAATDAAAAGGAESAYENSCGNNTATIAAAQADAKLNGYTTGSGVTVSVTPGPTTGVFANNPCAVDVTISNTNVPAFFSHAGGFLGVTIKESTHAVGLGSKPGGSNGCIWLLDTNSSETSNFSNAHISAPGCAIYINSTGSSNMSNGTINAAYIGYGSQAPNESGATFTTATPVPMSTPMSDPCSTIAGCTYLKNNASTIESQSGCPNLSAGPNANVGTAGGSVCYNTFALSGSGNTVCGLIVITGNNVNMSGGAHISSCASGVTFFFGSATNTINMSSSTLTMSAPTTGNTAGVLFWRDPSQSNTVTLSAANYLFSGLIYFPTSYVTYSAGSSGYTQLVFGHGNFSVSTGTTLASPPPGGGGTGGLSVTLGE